MNVKVITKIDELKKIKEKWEELESKQKNITIYQTYLYNITWWESIKEVNKYKLNIIIVLDKKENILGIAPLIIEEEKYIFLKITTLKFMGWGDYLDFLVLDENTNVGKIINLIFEEISKLNINKIMLTNINIKSLLGLFLRKHQKFNDLLEFQVECPQIIFKKYKNFEEFKINYLSNSVKKQRNKMLKDLKYKLIIEDNFESNRYKQIRETHIELKNYLNNLNNNQERRSIFENNEKNKFLEDFYKVSTNIKNFILVDSDNNIIIYDTCFIKNNRIVSWNMAHNYKFNNYNPGRVINYEIIQWIFEQENFQEYIFDFGCGGYSWKFQWTDDFTSVYKLEYDIQSNLNTKLLKKLQLLKRGVKCLIQAIKN